MTSLSRHIGKLHLVAGDFPIPHEVTNEYPSLPEFLKDSLRQYRLGQIPQWLMPAKVSHGVLEEDWDDHKAGIRRWFFNFLHTTWRTCVSFAIESQLARVPGVSEHL